MKEHIARTHNAPFGIAGLYTLQYVSTVVSYPHSAGSQDKFRFHEDILMRDAEVRGAVAADVTLVAFDLHDKAVGQSEHRAMSPQSQWRLHLAQRLAHLLKLAQALASSSEDLCFLSRRQNSLAD